MHHSSFLALLTTTPDSSFATSASTNLLQISEEQQAILEEFDRKRAARLIAVPTEDGEVRMRLRELFGEPQTLFGEGVSLLKVKGVSGQGMDERKRERD